MYLYIIGLAGGRGSTPNSGSIGILAQLYYRLIRIEI